MYAADAGSTDVNDTTDVNDADAGSGTDVKETDAGSTWTAGTLPDRARRRPGWRGSAAMPGAAPAGRQRTAPGPFRPTPAGGRAAAGGRRPGALRWKVVSALVLPALLAWPGVAARAELLPDPMIEAVQRELDERGYDPGEVDGLTGRRTRGAIREFQRSAGLPDTGQIDDATLAALGLALPDDVEPEAGPDTPEADTPQDEEPSPAPGTETPEAQAPSATLATAPGADASGIGVPRGEPASERGAAGRLSFAALGWHPPQTGADALARFNAIAAPPGFKRGTETLVVPKGELIFVLKAGERIPGIDCDPGAGGLSVEFIFGPDGPVIFTPAADGGYCQAGIGIALAVGRTLEMGRVDWGDVRYPRGTVRVTNQGLEYVR